MFHPFTVQDFAFCVFSGIIQTYMSLKHKVQRDRRPACRTDCKPELLFRILARPILLNKTV